MAGGVDRPPGAPEWQALLRLSQQKGMKSLASSSETEKLQPSNAKHLPAVWVFGFRILGSLEVNGTQPLLVTVICFRDSFKPTPRSRSSVSASWFVTYHNKNASKTIVFCVFLCSL